MFLPIDAFFFFLDILITFLWFELDLSVLAVPPVIKLLQCQTLSPIQRLRIWPRRSLFTRSLEQELSFLLLLGTVYVSASRIGVTWGVNLTPYGLFPFFAAHPCKITKALP